MKVCAYPYRRVILCERNFHEQETLWNVFKINLIPVHRISAESTKKSICKQRSEYKPTQDVSCVAYTMDKQLSLRQLCSLRYTAASNRSRFVVSRKTLTSRWATRLIVCVTDETKPWFCPVHCGLVSFVTQATKLYTFAVLLNTQYDWRAAELYTFLALYM